MKNFFKKIDIFDIFVGLSFIPNFVLAINDKSFDRCLWIIVAFLWFLMYVSARKKLDEVMKDFENYIKK